MSPGLVNKYPRLGHPLSASELWGSKQDTRFCTGGGEVRHSGTLPVGLSAFRSTLQITTLCDLWVLELSFPPGSKSIQPEPGPRGWSPYFQALPCSLPPHRRKDDGEIMWCSGSELRALIPTWQQTPIAKSCSQTLRNNFPSCERKEAGEIM